MTRQARSAIIRGLWQARVGVALTMGFIPTARAEIRKETATMTETVRAEMQDSILDEETAGIESHLPFDQVEKIEAKEDDSILSDRERKQLSREYYQHLDTITRPA